MRPTPRRATPFWKQDVAVDITMMRHCIHLSTTAPRGDLPIACVICDSDGIIAETTNQVRQNGDVIQHAEIVAIRQAQTTLKRKSLSHCTLYTTVEPCAMCSFMIRETQISRVVYSISSPMMGGISKWNILRDTEISNMIPEVFGSVPEVIANSALAGGDTSLVEMEPDRLANYQIS